MGVPPILAAIHRATRCLATPQQQAITEPSTGIVLTNAFVKKQDKNISQVLTVIEDGIKKTKIDRRKIRMRFHDVIFLIGERDG